MFKKALLALSIGLAAASAMAANTLDDAYLEKIRALQYFSPHPADYQNAAQQFIQTVDQSDGTALAALGRAFMRTQDYDNSQAVLISAVRIAPSNAQAQADLSFVSASHGDCEMSRTAYDRAVTLNASLANLRHVKRGHSLCPTE